MRASFPTWNAAWNAAHFQAHPHAILGLSGGGFAITRADHLPPGAEEWICEIVDASTEVES